MSEPWSANHESWNPPANVRMHNGDEVDPLADFFAPPPAEIGEVLTAESSLKRNVHPRPPEFRISLSLAVLAAVIGVSRLVARQIQVNPREIPWLTIVGIGTGLGVIVWFSTGFRHHCSYVGRKGVSRHSVIGRRESVPKLRQLVFAEATHLRTRQVRRFMNGVYTGTDYNHTWTNAGGAKVFELFGTFSSSKGTPKPGDTYYLATSAESAWSTHILESVLDELNTKGAVEFRLTRDNYVRVGHGFLELKVNGQPERLEVSDIKSLTVADGQFRVTHKDARWYGLKGRFSFAYADLANARLFPILLTRLTGLSV